MSQTTKKYRIWSILFSVLSLLANIAPLAIYAIVGLMDATLVVEKVGLAASIFVVLIMSLVAWVNKTTLRSRVWIILLGLYICLNNFITPLIIIACCQIADEWILSPMHKFCHDRYVINREIDKRG
jgi:hypothetical protein